MGAPDIARLGDEELKQRIREAKRDEDQVSFERRMLHGRIDVVRSEIRERLRAREGSTVEAADGLERLLANLTEVLSHVGPPPLEQELAAFGQTLEGDAAADEQASGELPDLAPLTDGELAALVRALVRRERVVSDRRNALFRDIDRLRSEHVARLQQRYGSEAGDSGE